MSCCACTRKYGLFCKEAGCPSCGFSFCTKCLKKTMEIEKLGGLKKHVCLKCFDKHEKQKLNNDESAIRRNVISVMDEPLPNDFNNDDVDKEIRNRLKSLKENKELNVSNDLDIAKRLAVVKGVEFKENTDYSFLHAVDKRTEQEQSNDLIRQYLEESSIDKSGNAEDPIKDIERRLAALKDSSFASASDKEKHSNIANNSDSEDDETKTKKLITKYMEEATLPDITAEEKEFLDSVQPIKSKDELKELPWCTICNEDAIVRCEGCDGDLFCRGCFEEIHDDDEYKQHPTTRYVKDTKSEYANH